MIPCVFLVIGGYLDLLALYKRLPMFMRIKIGIRGIVFSLWMGLVINLIDVVSCVSH